MSALTVRSTSEPSLGTLPSQAPSLASYAALVAELMDWADLYGWEVHLKVGIASCDPIGVEIDGRGRCRSFVIHPWGRDSHEQQMIHRVVAAAT